MGAARAVLVVPPRVMPVRARRQAAWDQVADLVEGHPYLLLAGGTKPITKRKVLTRPPAVCRALGHRRNALFDGPGGRSKLAACGCRLPWIGTR